MRKDRYCSGVIRVGLTGGIGSGKSTAGEFFASLGAIVVDSDQLSRNAIERGSAGFDRVIEHFGDSILKNGEIDRPLLGQIIFSNTEERLFLESVIHPYVAHAYDEIVKSSPIHSIVVNQIPLLVEVDAGSRFDLTITINSTIENRTARLINRGLSHSEINSRMNSQVNDERRAQYCDIVIENNGSRDDFLRCVENVWEELLTPYSLGEITHEEILARKQS